MLKLSRFIIIIGIGLSFINPTLVLAQSKALDVPKYEGVESSVQDFLCTPSEGAADGKSLEKCINKLYRFGISFGGIALVFFIVFAGYMYITGGESGKEKAKTILKNALIGMAMLLGCYVLLGFINPNLLLFKPIQPPIFDAPKLATCADLGLSNNCIVAGGEGGSSPSVGNGNIVQIATGELGKKGTAQLENSRYIASIFKTAQANNSGPQIDKYFVPGGTPGDPWCAYFATWVYGQAGIKTIGNLSGRGSTLGLISYFKANNGKRISEGTIKYFPASGVVDGSVNVMPGDLVLYDRGSSGDAKGHTSIALGYDPAKKTIASIDGNQDQSDEVKRVNRDILKECTGKDTCKLIGIGRVER